MINERSNIKMFLSVLLIFGIVTVFNTRNVEASTVASTSDRNIQSTREITIVDVEEFEELEREINNIQGMVIFQNQENNYSAYYSLLVPRKYFDENLDKILKYGTVKSDSRYQSDISKEVTTLEKSIISNEKHKEVIMGMIDKTKSIDLIIEFEQYLMDVEIEQTSNINKLNELKNLSNYTTLYLTIQKAEESQVYVEDSFIDRLGEAFSHSLESTKTFFESFFVGVSYVIIPFAFVACVVIVIIRIRKRGKDNEEK